LKPRRRHIVNKSKIMIPIGLALIVAATAGIFTHKWLKKQVTPIITEIAENEAVPVAVAAVDLPWGTKLTPEMVETVSYLKESLPPGYVSSAESLNDRVLVSPLKRNEPIVEARLAHKNVTRGGVSAVVQPGMRALAVKGDKVIGISGFIRPADRVDVLVTLTDSRYKRDVTKIVLEDILVLATGTEIVQNGEGKKPHSVDVYTLEVTPKDGEKLALSAAQGKLQFALRNVMDKETVLTYGATIPGTLASYRPKVKAAKRPFSVEVIKGNKVTKVKVKS
jgi:pilus assembly protein CpaB